MKTPEKNKLEKLIRAELDERREELGLILPKNSWVTSKKTQLINEVKKDLANKPTAEAKKLAKVLDNIKDQEDKIKKQIRDLGYQTNSYGAPIQLSVTDTHKEVIAFKESLEVKDKELKEVEKDMIVRIWSDGATMEKVFKDFRKLILNIKL